MQVPAELLHRCSSITGGRGSAFEVQSQREPTGVLFAPGPEVALDPHMRSLAARLPGASAGLLVVPQVVGPHGVADLVAATYVGDRLERRLTSGATPLLSPIDVAVVAAARHRAVTRDQLAQALQRDPRSLQGRIKTLIESGALELTASGVRAHADLQPIGRLWAFEAKVSDWQSGVGQAQTYALWTDASSLVIERLPRSVDRLLEACKRLRLGLAHEDRWLTRPRLDQGSYVARLAGSEAFVAALRAG